MALLTTQSIIIRDDLIFVLANIETQSNLSSCIPRIYT